MGLERRGIRRSDEIGGATYDRAAEKVAEYLKCGQFDRARYLTTCMENFSVAAVAYDEMRRDTEYCSKDFVAGIEHLMGAAAQLLSRHIERTGEVGMG